MNAPKHNDRFNTIRSMNPAKRTGNTVSLTTMMLRDWEFIIPSVVDALNATVSTEEEKIRVVEIATNDANDPVVTFETEAGATVFEAWMKDQLLTAEEIAA